MDERGVIAEITRRAAKRLPPGYLPIGDDVALLPVDGDKLVLKADMLVGKTDVPPRMGWRRAARKAVTMCVSDFAAKGVRPDSFMVSLGLPRGTPDGQVRALARGFAEAAREWHVKLVGGDTSEAPDLVVDCLMAGFTDRAVVRRDTASEGQLVVTTGTFGEAAAGLRILLGGASASPKFRRNALSHVYLPKARLDAGLALGGYLSSSMDSSDGLALSLHAISEMSGVGITINELPCTSEVSGFASQNSLPVEDLVLYGGEEYEIVGTLPKGRLAGARRTARSLGCDLLVIGETTRKRRVRFSDGKAVQRRGWVHLSGSGIDGSGRSG